jgi:pimeloyl-ACP methyl ester carboxylesterase
MYAFFQKHLNNPGDPADKIVELLSKDELKVTQSGQVSVSLKGETVFSLNKKDFESNIPERELLSGENDSWRRTITSEAKRLSGYVEPSEDAAPVFSGRTRKASYFLDKYFVKGEGEYVIPYLVFVPFIQNGTAVIYLHPAGKAAEAKEGGEIEKLVKEGFTVLAPDLIGTGETGNGQFKGDAYIDGESHNLWYCSIVIGRSILGIRTADVIRLVNILKKDKRISTIWGMARMEMAPVMMHAAAFSSSVERVILAEPLASYKSLVTSHLYKASFISSTVPAALTRYDLPELAGTLAPRKLTIVNPVNSMGKPDNSPEIKSDMDVIRAYYKRNGAEDKLKILFLTDGENADITELIK